MGSDGTSVIYMVRRMAEFKKSKNPGHLKHTQVGNKGDNDTEKKGCICRSYLYL